MIIFSINWEKTYSPKNLFFFKSGVVSSKISHTAYHSAVASIKFQSKRCQILVIFKSVFKV